MMQLPCYSKMKCRWDLINDLLGGTQAMRDAGSTWLPRETSESEADYKVRLGRSILFEAYSDTIEKIVAKPFSQDLTVEEKTDWMDAVFQDMDQEGSDLHNFARDIFEAGINYGMVHVYCEFPSLAPGATAAEDNARRPFFILIKPSEVPYWQYKVVNGRKILTEVHFLETRYENDKEVVFRRIVTITEWKLVKEDNHSEVVEQGTHSFGAIPLFTYYVRKTAFMQSRPALEGLAWLNVAHWQSQSDQRNILRYARIAILCAFGFDDQEAKDIVFGPNFIAHTSRVDAKLEFVEHHGYAIKAGQEDLDRLEQKMEILGMQPFMDSTPYTTATGRTIDESRTQNSVQSWIRRLEVFLAVLIRAAAQWKRLDVSEDFRVQIFNDFSLFTKSTEDVRTLTEMRSKNLISPRLFFNELRRRSTINEAVKYEDEEKALRLHLEEVSQREATLNSSRGSQGGPGTE